MVAMNGSISPVSDQSIPSVLAAQPIHPIKMNDIVEDPARMLVRELKCGQAPAVDWVEIHDDHVVQVRPDFGIALLPSVLGARAEVTGNNPPWVHPVSDEDVVRCIERIVDTFDVSRSLEMGWMPRALDAYDYFRDAFKGYPKVTSSIAVTLPNLMGPLEVAGLLWGGDIFAALYERPELVERLLRLIVDVTVHIYGILREKAGTEPLPRGFTHQHGSIIRGNFMLRSDSVVMMSREMYTRQVFPIDRDLLGRVGGGSFHSCGAWGHTLPAIIAAEEIGSIDMGSNQTHLHDMEAVYRLAREYRKHVHLVMASPEEVRSGDIMNRYPTGVTLLCEVNTREEASALVSAQAS